MHRRISRQAMSVIKRVTVTLKRPSGLPRQGLPRVDSFDVVVGEIINPGHFYLQLGKSSQDLI